ncbi:hypothetical protein [Mesorhizobium neociceri]|uniref:Uncharacterized protein n=1 Tax=Mesorhizobium neociceri TaxID=1307853 RepID=A0A838B6P4_9HYPH|nr:hypothetical protein [Mesorhizobium neociceri]MBA1141747.1 hypothetical protein [Mesorhizobium neociceri]
MSAMKAVSVLISVRVAQEGNVHGREIIKGTDDEIPEEMFESLAKAGYVEAIASGKKGKKTKPSADEAREAMIADLGALSDDELAGIIKAEKITVDAADSRDAVLGKIADARIAAQA